MISAAAGAAYAQQAPAPAPSDQELQTVVVSGIREALEKAAEEKRSEESIVEVVSQEDIGKLSDPSVAESISRLTGLAGQRVHGRVQDISIRGFSGDYVTTLLNGREQASTGDNRAVEFDQYPSEVVQSVMVYKTTDAERVSSGLAGTVDLRTMRPLSYRSNVYTVGVRVERNSLGNLNPEGSSTDYRANATYIAHFLDDRLGVGLGYARLDSPEQEQHYKAWWWSTNNDPNNVPYNNGAVTLNGAELYDYSRHDVRDGLVGAIEYKPNEVVHSVTDLYFSRFAQHSWDRGWEAFLCPCQTGQGIANPTYTSVGAGAGTPGTPGASTSFVTAGTYNSIQSILLNQYATTHDRLSAFGENFEVDLGSWKTAADLSYSYAHRQQQWTETYAGYTPFNSAAGDTSIPFSNALAGLPALSSTLNYANASAIQLGDPAPWGGWGHDGVDNRPISTDKIKAVRLSAQREFQGPIRALHFGTQYEVRDKTLQEQEFDLFLNNNGTPINVPSSLLKNPVSNAWAGFGNVIAYDMPRAMGQLYTLRQFTDNNGYAGDFTVNEKLTSGFLQFELNSKIGDLPVRGNFGAQLVHSRQSTTGFCPGCGPTGQPVSGGTSYNDFLPSANIIFDLTPEVLLRTYAAKVMVRPLMNQLGDYVNATPALDTVHSTPNNPVYVWSGSGGNPLLRPWRADAYDVSIEKYFTNASYFSIAGFYKHFTSFIYDAVGNNNYNFSGLNPNGVGPFSSPYGNFSQPQNLSGGNVRGLEASLNLELKLLWSGLEGFGTQIGEAWTTVNVPPDPNTGPTLPGFSPRVHTFTFYYERFGFEARVAERYRDEFVGTVQSTFDFRNYTQILADRQLDAEIGYGFSSGRFKGLSLTLVGTNLLNSAYRDTTGALGTTALTTPQVYERYGRVFLGGFNYKY
ncbi:MAG TPA: TonB-dependent receptor [Steroidobacteraceae bacterium]|nr:TonB-dependent receptor [Steroidobacteraceae bacterium]